MMAYINEFSNPFKDGFYEANTTQKSIPSTTDSMSTILMERLYKKSNQMKNWNDISKCIKQSILEKRPIITDNNDLFQLQRCLDTLQKNIEVKSVQSLVERLESICRQLKLKFYFRNFQCFVHSDMYYVEISLDVDSGRVMDCKIHQDEALSCPELVDVLQRGDFIEFTKHLEGLSAIYQIDTDKNNKEKAFSALHALETDLVHLADIQKNQINDINNFLHKSPLGVLEPRKGGHSMKLTFFVPPYDLIDLKSKSILPLTFDTIKERKLGYSATICIEESAVIHKLQKVSLITVKTNDGKNLPQVSRHSSSNTNSLPACFVLKLANPLPICHDQAKKICNETGIDFPNLNEKRNLIDLLAKQMLPNFNYSKSSSFFATLPGQNHCYYVNGNPEVNDAILIDKIPFTHPTHVPKILVCLRQQVLFNVIIGSIIRQLKKSDQNSHIFEVSYSGLSNIYVQFENPIEQSLATMDIDLRDITSVKCKLYPNFLINICSDDFVSKIMQKSLSIPVTMRLIINRSRESIAKSKENSKKDTTSSSLLSLNDLNSKSNNSSDNSNVTNKQKNFQSMFFIQQFNQLKSFNPNMTVAQQKQLINQLKAKQNSGNTMLMSMLSDIPHAAQKNKKRKRLSSGEITLSPKRRQISYDKDPDVELIEDINPDSSTCSNQFYSLKSNDDGHNEQLKIIKSLEEISQKDDLPKLILKNDKSLNNLKITKAQKSDLDLITGKKERKRKRADSFESKDSGISLTITSSSMNTNLSDSTSNALSQKLSQAITSSSSLTKLISVNSITPPKMKKSSASPLSSPTQSMAKGIPMSNALKHSEKIASMLKNSKSSSLSMLSSSKISEFEAAAAAAVAASAGGSSVAAAVAAANAVSSLESKRFIKQIKSKPNNGSKSPITLSVSSSLTTSIRPGKVQSGLSSTLKQKSLSASCISSAGSSGITSPKILQQQMVQSPMMQAAAAAAAAAAAISSSSANQKACLQKSLKKGSLTAVVDRLRQNAGDGASVTLPGGQVTIGQCSTSPEISSASSNRPDSSGSKSTNSSKSNEKAKYFRNPDSQFTIKQSNSGLKMSITKNKPLTQTMSSSTADLISKFSPSGTGLFKSSNTKYTIPKIAKNQSSASSVTSSSSTVSTNASITSPTLSSSSSSIVASSSPSSKKPNNGIKSSNSLISKSSKSILSSTSPNSSGSISSGGKTSPAPGQMKISPKNNVPTSMNKVFKNPDSIIYNKINPPITVTNQPSSVGNRPNVSTALFKNYNSSWPSVSSDHSKSAVSSSDMYSLESVRASGSVSSSSDINNKSLPTSTPSSPAECSPLPEAKNPPLIIPTEAIPDDKLAKCESTSKDVDSSLSEYSNKMATADSSIISPGDMFLADQSIDQVSKSSQIDNSFKRSDPSPVENQFYSKTTIPPTFNEYPSSTSTAQQGQNMSLFISSNINETDLNEDALVGSSE